MSVINNSLPGDRIQVLDYPAALPAVCVVCKAGGGKPTQGPSLKFIDFGMDIEYYGAVYFCSNCIVNIAHALGYRDPAFINIMVLETVALKLEVMELKEQNDSLRSAIHSLSTSLGVPAELSTKLAESENITSSIEVPTGSESEFAGQSSESERPNVPSFEFNNTYDL